MAPKLYKSADVCEMAQLQLYVLRSWEKEFPGIGVQTAAGVRLYRQSDVDQVLRIKQLVFGDGLTVAGARRKLAESEVASSTSAADDVAEVLDALASNARTRIAYVRDGLRSLLRMLSSAPGTVVLVDDDHLTRPPAVSTPDEPRPRRERGSRAVLAARRPAKKASGKRSRANA